MGNQKGIVVHYMNWERKFGKRKGSPWKLMLRKLQENKHVVFWMEKETKHISLWIKTSNPWGVPWIHKVIEFWNLLERNRQSLYFYKFDNWIVLEAIICLIIKETLGQLGQCPETLIRTNHKIRWQNSDFCQK